MCLLLSGTYAASDDTLPDDEVLRAWVEEMKTSARGPFARIRWFCKDGAILPPEAYACKDHGGGSQHGEWTERVKLLRAQGFHLANVLADLDVDGFVQNPFQHDILGQMLIEQYLLAVDDGWILRKARYYRGALQEEGERLGARRLLLELAEDPVWLDRYFAPLRIAARLLSHGAETGAITEIRQSSASLSNRDARFMSVRNKIHVRPERADATLVRDYARGVTDAGLRSEYESLARLIEETYASPRAAARLEQLADDSGGSPALEQIAREGSVALAQAKSARERFMTSAVLLARLRDALAIADETKLRIEVLDVSLALEDEHFIAATELDTARRAATRGEWLELMEASVTAIYGVGYLRARQLDALRGTLSDLRGGDSIPLALYKSNLEYLALLPAWSSQQLRFHFFEPMGKLARLDPLANLFIQDQLRGSPLFFFAQVLDGALRDANRLAGVRNDLFGEDVGAGLRPLNPGLAGGILHVATEQPAESFSETGIYLLPETISDLPPIAGILTTGEGNPLSHVQLLARNLGIPNVGVDEALIPKLVPNEGRRVLLAVSPAGSVRLSLPSEEEWGRLFGEEKVATDILIEPDLEKLDLGVRDFVPLGKLRATDSGRIVGPKAAKLGELFHLYPEAVADGLAIPFGIFREMLDQPYKDSGKSAFEWMIESYRRLEQLAAGSDSRAAATESFRSELERWVEGADPGDAFRDRLAQAMGEAFGPDGGFGVFVRSDTNVEDLPGFTGAGLNLTLPNVVGYHNIFAAISKVWASPFTARAFAWRQSHMSQPEHVYPAILLLRSVPAEKSGVLVTQEIDTGDRDWLSVAVNEGVGGAVDGQAAESLRISMATGEVRLMAQATATLRRKVNPGGGVEKIPVSGADEVLRPDEIGALVELARGLPERFPAIVDGEGKPAPADIEFGFLDGKLRLFQIRPFLESVRARSSAYLNGLDAGLRETGGILVDLTVAAPAS